MISRSIIAACALLCAGPALAQSTKAQLNSQFSVSLPDNSVGAITPSVMRSTFSSIVNSIMPTAPVVSGNLACFDGTTGLLLDCSSAPTPNAITALTGDITATGPGSVAATLATVNSNVGSFGSATASTTLTVNGKGLVTAVLSQTITPAIGSITGLGTGVATGLAGNATGSGGPVLTTSPTLVTPNVGVATATSVNKVAITAPATSATLAIANSATLTATTSTSIGQGQYLGTATNDSATAGNIGEYLASSVVTGSAISLTTNTPVNLTSVSLTAGDWDVWCHVLFNTTTATGITILAGSLNTTTATLNTAPTNFSQFAYPSSSLTSATTDIPDVRTRVSVNTTTTEFCVVQATFGSAAGTVLTWGSLQARRLR